MMKLRLRLLLSALLLTCSLLLSGCWNYWSLDEMIIVTGIAIDKEPETGSYRLMIETVDTKSAADDDKLQVQYIETEGDTIFSAIRNAKRRLNNKLYGGHMELVVISQQLAEREGVLPLLEDFLRDGEPRETLSIAIAQDVSAKDILLAKGIETNIVSYDIGQSIEEDCKTTASTRYVPLYKAYSAVKAPGDTLVLPALHHIENNGEQVVETNGLAVFRTDRLTGWLSPEQTMYYLFFRNEIKGGVFSFRLSEDQAVPTAMEIKKSTAKVDYRFNDGQLTVTMKAKVAMNLMELNTSLDLQQASERTRLEQTAAGVLNKRISGLFAEVQTAIGSDIFGLGNLIYKDDPTLWRKLEGNWDSIFQTAQLHVETQVDLLNSGVLKSY